MAGKAIKTKKKYTAVARKKKLKEAVRKSVKKRKKVLAIPKGYTAVTPYLIFRQASAAIDFYRKAFGAKEVMRMEHAGGKIGHAELKIGDAKIMLADERPEMHARSPETYGGSPMSIHLYVKDADVVVARAVSLGARMTRPVENMFYGDRSGMIQDPFGYQWCVSTHVEDVTPAKLKSGLQNCLETSD